MEAFCVSRVQNTARPTLNTKLGFYTPRKLIGRLTQQSAQPEPQNSAGTRHKELNLGSKKPQNIGNHFCRRREDGDWGGRGGSIWVKHPSPKAAGEKVENWKQPQGLN